jgi:ABC-type protease/lipase transport system fused ATPase/permease subunit
LKARLDEARTDLKEKEQKLGALQRNFESLSALCMKTEAEKSTLVKMNQHLTVENRNYASELLGKIQQIKKLQAELE